MQKFLIRSFFLVLALARSQLSVSFIYLRNVAFVRRYTLFRNFFRKLLRSCFEANDAGQQVRD